MNTVPPTPPGPLTKLLSLVVAAGVLALGFMFSLVIIPVLLVTGLAAWAYLRWKFRQLQKAMAAQMDDPAFAQQWQGSDGATGQGEVIEGEVVVVREGQETVQEILISHKTDGSTSSGNHRDQEPH